MLTGRSRPTGRCTAVARRRGHRHKACWRCCTTAQGSKQHSPTVQQQDAHQTQPVRRDCTPHETAAILQAALCTLQPRELGMSEEVRGYPYWNHSSIRLPAALIHQPSLVCAWQELSCTSQACSARGSRIWRRPTPETYIPAAAEHQQYRQASAPGWSAAPARRAKCF